MEAKKVHSSRGLLLSFLIEKDANGSLIASAIPLQRTHIQDDLGALYYVVAVVVIYGFSIVMMIASYIRKNKEDQRLKRCLQEMAFVRKRDRHMALMWAATKAANLRRNALIPSQIGETSSALDPDLSAAGVEPDDKDTATVWVKQTEPREQRVYQKRLSEGNFSTTTVQDKGRRSLDCQYLGLPSGKLTKSLSNTRTAGVESNKMTLVVPNREITECSTTISLLVPPRKERKWSCPSLQVVSNF